MKKIISVLVLFFTQIQINSRSIKNLIINGHPINELKDPLYIGQSEKEIITLLGKPFVFNEKNNILYFFYLERKVYPLPIYGSIKKGTILKITLDKNRKVEEIEYINYKNYKPSGSLKKLIKELEIEKKEKELKIKEIQKQYMNYHKKRKKMIENDKKNEEKQAKNEQK